MFISNSTVHLTGNYIGVYSPATSPCMVIELSLTALDQRPPDQDPYSDGESEDDFDLRDVSSDVEINPDELDIPSDDEGCV